MKPMFLLFTIALIATFVAVSEQATIAETPTCGVNQVYRCSHGCESHCPESPWHPCDPVIECMYDCHCATGFVIDRGQDGKCVQNSACKAIPHQPVHTQINAHGAPNSFGMAVGK